MSFKEYGRYPFRVLFSNGMTLQRGGWYYYRGYDGVIIPSEVINEENEVLLCEIAKREPLVFSE